MSADSHFSDETETAVEDAQQVWAWMRSDFYVSDDIRSKPVSWWKRPRIVYSTLCLVVAAMIALAATGMVVGMEGMTGLRPKKGGAGESPASGSVSDQDDNIVGGIGNTTNTTNPTASPTASPTSSPTASPTAPPPPRTTPLAFYVMGDVPYSQWEERVLIAQLANLTASRHPGSAFIVHVGDMMVAERTACQANFYTHIKNILLQGPLPTFVLAGDNDYLDCPSPDEAWGFYQDHFSDFDEEWSYRLPAGVPLLGVDRWLLPENVPLEENVTRWTTRPEMFAFVEEGILFLSMTLMHTPDDLPPDGLFQERVTDSKKWVTQQVTEAAAEHTIRGVVMFGHARISGYLRPFFMELKQIFSDALVTGPVLYIHGDGHQFNFNQDFGQSIAWNEFIDIQVDQGAYADPLLVEVGLWTDGILTPLTSNNPNQYIAGDGVFRIDRQSGRYPNIEDENV